MDNLWPPTFKEPKTLPPSKILEEQLSYLPSLTGDKVYGEVEKLGMTSYSEHAKHDFRYVFKLKSKFIRHYSFSLFSFSHDVIYYPVTIKLDEEVAREINEDEVINVESEDLFVKVLGVILKSKRVDSVITSIMRISPEDDPFGG
ncbi:MAG: hypothetical protein Q3M30_18670 [Candidatus Electrothrix sp. Rat3]|nr:hypothetical protein [Candidatus Electrothrix rattekaaiensis]